MTFETIKVFSNAMEAHILKAALEAQGIQCYLFDENIVSMNPLYSNVVGGIKLKVAAADKELALQVLTEIDETPYTDNDDHVIKCPKCLSTNIESGKIKTKGIWPKIVGFISLILFIYPVSVDRVYRCKDCDTEFK